MMRELPLLFLFLLGYSYAQNNYSELLKQYYNNGKYDECFDLASQASRSLSGKDKAEAYYYMSLSYGVFSKDEIKEQEYPNALKKSAKFLSKGIRKDKGLNYYTLNKPLLVELKADLEREVKRLYRAKKPGLATYIEKTLAFAYKNIEENDQKDIKVEDIRSEDQITDPTPVSDNKSVDHTASNLVSYAKTKIGVPYKYGGMSDAGFDCSGYTSVVYKRVGVKLPRTSSEQAKFGYKVKLREAQKGDLIFFEKKGVINHVGIVISEKGEELAMIHASTSKGIRVDYPLSDPYWKDKIKMIKRII